MKKIIVILFSGVLSMSLPGCGDFLEEYSQTLSYVDELEDLDALLLGGGYLPTRSAVAPINWIHYMDDDTEEIWVGAGTGKTVTEKIRGFHQWERYPFWEEISIGGNVSTDDYGGNTTWKEFYARLAVVNATIEEVERFAGDQKTHAEYLRIKGSAYFLRGLYYFYLTNLWGAPYQAATAGSDLAVPLKTESAIKPGGFARNTVEEAYEQIISDLKIAAECLQPIEKDNKLYANAAAAELLLARVYLYQCNWTEARTWANKVIEKVSNVTFRMYDLNQASKSTYQKEFRDASWCEYIFCAGYSHTTMASVNVNFKISDSFYNNYAENDLRKSLWITDRKKNSVTWKAFYYLTTSAAFSPMSFKLPEAYLIEAEAAAMEDDWTSATAALRKIRENRIETGMEDIAYESFTGQELIDFIRAERRRELAFSGHRWFDLRRYAVLPKYPLKTTIRHPYYSWGNDMAVLEGYHELGEWPQDGGWLLPMPTYALQNNAGLLVDNPRPERQLVE